MDPTENISTGSETAPPGHASSDLQGHENTAAGSRAYQPESDDVAELGALESDMAAVEQAISTLDEISSRGVGGESAAKEIAAAVSKDRFGR
ncbi:MAG: hypothetical protein WBA45_02500 [Microthrixaceae bacterium]